jgi:hypothetical protein
MKKHSSKKPVYRVNYLHQKEGVAFAIPFLFF